MKITYPTLDLAIFIIRALGFLQLIVGVTSLFTNLFGNLNFLNFILLLISSSLTFALAELFRLAIDISENTKKTINQLDAVSVSLNERDKVILKIMNIISEQLKTNKF